MTENDKIKAHLGKPTDPRESGVTNIEIKKAQATQPWLFLVL